MMGPINSSRAQTQSGLTQFYRDHLKVLRQLLSALIGRVHGEEDSELHVHLDHVAVGEDERLPLLLLAREHHRDLEVQNEKINECIRSNKDV